jgi:hypothetical protein
MLSQSVVVAHDGPWLLICYLNNPIGCNDVGAGSSHANEAG